MEGRADRIDTGQLSSRVTWLEDEQRQTKVQLTKIEGQLEQLWNLQRERALWQDETDRSMVAFRGQLARTAGVDEMTRQIRDRVAAIQEDYASHVQANEKVERLFQTEHERLRQNLTDHWHHLELLRKQLDDSSGRLGLLVDGLRRQGESITQIVHQVEEAQSQWQSLAARQQLNSDQIRRNEQELARVERELEPLRKQDEVVMTKILIVSDQARRAEEQANEAASREHLIHELADSLQALRLEQQRTSNATTELNLVMEEHARMLEEQLRQLKVLEERRVGQSERIAEVHQSLLDHVRRMEEQLAEFQQMEEQQKVRELVEMERQLKEIKERVARMRTQVPVE